MRWSLEKINTNQIYTTQIGMHRARTSRVRSFRGSVIPGFGRSRGSVVPGFGRSRGSAIPGTEMQGSAIDLLCPIAGVHRI